jgi:hypothetical protein
MASGLSPIVRYYGFGDKDRMFGYVDALPQGTVVFFWRPVKLLAVNANVNEITNSTLAVNSQHSPALRVVPREEAT